MPTKRCGSCGRLLPSSEFWRRSDSPDGWDWYCRACHSAMSAAWSDRQSRRDAGRRDEEETARLRDEALARAAR